MGDVSADINGHVLRAALQSQRRAFVAEGFPSAATRRDRLNRFLLMIVRNAGVLGDAAVADFEYRSREFSGLFALAPVVDTLYQRIMLRHLMRPRRGSLLMTALGIDQQVRPEPKGVIGIMGPWNFPTELTLMPVAAVLAAGNRAMLWQSPQAPASAGVLADIVSTYFSDEELVVFSEPNGSGEMFSGLPFDHLFFTGSSRTGAKVAEAAGRNLVPVTLELGGKNPAIVSDGVDVGRAAKTLAGLRLVNGGQACICPDYVFISEERMDSFVDLYLAECQARYPQMDGHAGYTSIIDERNYRRVVGLLDDAAAKGARIRQVDGPHSILAAERKIAPTVVTGVSADMNIDQEEIFGPVLCVHPYRSMDEVVSHLARREAPLTMYWFGSKGREYQKVLNFTRSGSVNIGDGVFHIASPFVPFGGVGSSGMGVCHGRYGFSAFSHLRPVVHSRLPFSLASFLTPPYPRAVRYLAEKILR